MTKLSDEEQLIVDWFSGLYDIYEFMEKDSILVTEESIKLANNDVLAQSFICSFERVR